MPMSCLCTTRQRRKSSSARASLSSAKRSCTTISSSSVQRATQRRRPVAICPRPCAGSRQRSPFVSRGDRSGTHAAELRYWKDAGVDLLTAVRGDWYKEVGQGIGPALDTGSAANAYVLTIAAPGSRSRIVATSPSWLKATSASSTKMASSPGEAPLTARAGVCDCSSPETNRQQASNCSFHASGLAPS